ncbi:IclR family transcriptional regulator [Herbiconiux daphne]|uniref:IclR family transcriptional regulator n=1 Tax=Herbiconiux daphne TaxID=2970914 RepID=A0ABT2GYE9_9MICO|nr:IclR family transcriptional regulator [Herbiconiux daphne]MCS5732943.1 IclR family transcriptional regulator [Herbiconiux daphne]
MVDEVPAARSTLRILSFMAAQRGPVAASTIATALELPRSSVYKLLGVLEQHGFVLHFPELRRYGVGIAAFELSSGYSRQAPLARLGSPILATLVDKIGESAHLAVLHGRDVLYIVEERAPRRPALVTDVGVRLPSHLTASGRALLAALPAAQVRALFPDRAAFAHRLDTPQHPGIETYGALKRVLAGVREQGFATEDGDVTEGIASVGVAVRDHAGWPAAAIAVTFPTAAIEQSAWPALAHDVKHFAAELTRRIRGLY